MSLLRRISIPLFCLLLVYFVWMDIQLYLYIQDTQISSIVNLLTPTAAPRQTFPFSPFHGFSVKLAMLDQVDNYIYSPLAEAFESYCDISHRYPFITANTISVLGVLFASLAALLVYRGKKYHRLAVAVFQLRIFCDALDGLVARRRQGIDIQMSIRSTEGYYADAIADTLGVIIFVVACYLYLRRCDRRVAYLPLKASVKETTPPWPTTFIVSCFALQLLITGLLWNNFIEQYHTLLESPSKDTLQYFRRNAVFHSNVTWTLWWLWKLFCGHSLTNMLLVAVYFNKLMAFLSAIQWLGLIVLLSLGLLSHLHIHHISKYILG